jgi:multiple sugar transport system ATP-binding protein
VAERVFREHPALEDYLGRKVILGIRPEHLEDAALVPDASPGSVIDVQVDLREELGSEVDLHCRVGADLVVARMDPKTTLTENQSAKVHVDLAALHFFDPETGASLRG